MIIELPFPASILWPNGRGHHMRKHKATKTHKGWARVAALAKRADAPSGDRLRLVATFHCKPAGPLPDKDNAGASIKAYQDGIAWALGVDDRHFGQPVVQFGDRAKYGKVIIEVVAT
ncbi:hypothetical protein [Sphingobium sp. Z007]|uniref:hypothetical protein n=1 Tax=Sphingobium sp. Z007 TaxID=627495 RepID=UPI000B49715B|nr:hypothetical protein [Sphingobium sp. Z007]